MRVESVDEDYPTDSNYSQNVKNIDNKPVLFLSTKTETRSVRRLPFFTDEN